MAYHAIQVSVSRWRWTRRRFGLQWRASRIKISPLRDDARASRADSFARDAQSHLTTHSTRAFAATEAAARLAPLPRALAAARAARSRARRRATAAAAAAPSIAARPPHGAGRDAQCDQRPPRHCRRRRRRRRRSDARATRPVCRVVGVGGGRGWRRRRGGGARDDRRRRRRAAAFAGVARAADGGRAARDRRDRARRVAPPEDAHSARARGRMVGWWSCRAAGWWVVLGGGGVEVVLPRGGLVGGVGRWGCC